MSKVRSADTKPEWILRCGLHRLGFRYRLRDDRLPGRPDLVFPRHGSVIFVHGCYWHRHPGCRDASVPKSNTAFWHAKFSENVQRDKRNRTELERRGWRVLVVWECELVNSTTDTIRTVAEWLTAQGPPGAEHLHSYKAADRRTLLTVAESRVRERIASYGKKPSSSAPESHREPEL